jgi:hypothetical protein
MAVQDAPGARRDEQTPALSPARRQAGAGARHGTRHRVQHPTHYRFALVVVLLLVLLIADLISFALVLVFSPPPLATITLTPLNDTARRVILLQPVLGAPSASNQLPVQRLTITSAVRTATVSATGSVQQPARTAHGEITLFNVAPYAQTVPAGSVLTAGGGLQFQTSSDAFVPAASGSYEGNIPVKAQAMQVGASGNIAPHAISMNCCTNSRINGIYAINESAFVGGQDAASYAVVLQRDIDQATAPLVAPASQDAQAGLMAQVRSAERLVASPTCTPTVKPSVPANERAVLRMTVAVAVTCSADRYAWLDALQRATTLFERQEAAVLAATYRLEGPIAVPNTAGIAQGAKRGELFVSLTLRGLWVFQIDRSALKRLQAHLAGKPWREAQTLLQRVPGVYRATLSPEGDTLPTDAGRIVLSVEAPPNTLP